MKLDDYLSPTGTVTPQAFAALTDMSEASISRLRRGEQRPSADALQKILDASKGAVTPNDFFDGIPAAPATTPETPKQAAA